MHVVERDSRFRRGTHLHRDRTDLVLRERLELLPRLPYVGNPNATQRRHRSITRIERHAIGRTPRWVSPGQ